MLKYVNLKNSIVILLSLLFILSCNNANFCKDENCRAKSSSTNISCKLTSDKLQQRRSEVLEILKKQIIEKRELIDGYAFKFKGSDEVFDELTAFIKTERQCCDFFTFNLSVGGDKKEIWLELTGPHQAKELMKAELGL